MDLKYAKNITDKKATIKLHGVVGGRIDGDEVASEIDYLIKIAKVTEITELINSEGGEVFNGLSIVSANFRAREAGIQIITQNDGIAASMAGVFFLTGTKRIMRDYSLLMLHEPTFWGENIDDLEDGKVKTALVAIKEQLAQIIMSQTGKTKAEVDVILKDETWLDAKEAKKQGFADEVLKSPKQPKIKTGATTSEIIKSIAAFASGIDNNDDNQTQKDNKMKAINAKLGLQAEASEDSAITAITAKDTKISKLEGQVKELAKAKADIVEKDAIIAKRDERITALETEQKEHDKQLVTAAVDQAEKDGIIKTEKKAELIEQFTDNYEGLKMILDNLNVSKAPILTNQLGTGTKPDAKIPVIDGLTEEQVKMGMREMEKKHPEVIAKLSEASNELFYKYSNNLEHEVEAQ